jgi:hypothetical protein
MYVTLKFFDLHAILRAGNYILTLFQEPRGNNHNQWMTGSSPFTYPPPTVVPGPSSSGSSGCSSGAYTGANSPDAGDPCLGYFTAGGGGSADNAVSSWQVERLARSLLQLEDAVQSVHHVADAGSLQRGLVVPTTEEDIELDSLVNSIISE